MPVRWSHVVVDCADPERVARFWAAVLDWEVEAEDDEYLVRPRHADETTTTLLTFLRVPEGKAVKNRLHIDLRPDDRDAEVARIVALGARPVDIGQAGDETWVVLADPEGNEFCVLRAL